MSRYDGLIIPRSYSEYINKTDAATLQQALQLSGVLSGAVAAGDNKAVKSSAVNAALANYQIGDIANVQLITSDINNIKNGIFAVSGAAPNNPNNAFGFLQTIYRSSTSQTQIFHEISSNRIYSRTYNGTVWSKWESALNILTVQNITTSIDVNTLIGDTLFIPQSYNIIGSSPNLPTNKGGRLTVLRTIFNSQLNHYLLQKYEKCTTDNNTEIWYRIGKSTDRGETWTFQNWEKLSTRKEYTVSFAISGSQNTQGFKDFILSKIGEWENGDIISCKNSSNQTAKIEIDKVSDNYFNLMYTTYYNPKPQYIRCINGSWLFYEINTTQI